MRSDPGTALPFSHEGAPAGARRTVPPGDGIRTGAALDIEERLLTARLRLAVVVGHGDPVRDLGGRPDRQIPGDRDVVVARDVIVNTQLEAALEPIDHLSRPPLRGIVHYDDADRCPFAESLHIDHERPQEHLEGSVTVVGAYGYGDGGPAIGGRG